MRDDYNRWPGTGACNGLGNCGCFGQEAFNGPCFGIQVVLSPWGFKPCNSFKGDGHGAQGNVCIFITGAFDEYSYRREGTKRKIATRNIARFWNNGEGQTWLDEEYAKHVGFNSSLVHLSKCQAAHPADSGYEGIITANNFSQSDFTREVSGFPDQNITSGLHKILVGRPGQEKDEVAPPAGGSFYDTAWVPRNHFVDLGNQIIQIDAGDLFGYQIGAVSFGYFVIMDGNGNRVERLSANDNLHLCRWHEGGDWILGSRYSVNDISGARDDFTGFDEPRELHLVKPLTGIGGIRLIGWDGRPDHPGGESDANTNIITSGLSKFQADTEEFQYIIWGRRNNYTGVGYDWDGGNNDPNKEFQLMKITKGGLRHSGWQSDVRAEAGNGNGPIPYDTDADGNVYFGGPVTHLTGGGAAPAQYGIYRVDKNGENAKVVCTVSGGAGRIYNAKVFSSKFTGGSGFDSSGNAAAWDSDNGASQLIVAGDFETLTPGDDATWTDTVDAINLAVVSIAEQEIGPQTKWPSPYNAGGTYNIGDFMPGLIW